MPWNVIIRRVLNLDRRTHRFLIEPLSKIPHLQTILVSRFMKFVQTLRSFKKFGVRLLSNLCCHDMSTVTGRNIDRTLKKCSISNIDIMNIKHLTIKQTFKYWDSDGKTEQAELADKLFQVLAGNYEIPGLEFDDAALLFQDVCVN